MFIELFLLFVMILGRATRKHGIFVLGVVCESDPGTRLSVIELATWRVRTKILPDSGGHFWDSAQLKKAQPN